MLLLKEVNDIKLKIKQEEEYNVEELWGDLITLEDKIVQSMIDKERGK